jgi:hypothetical protein
MSSVASEGLHEKAAPEERRFSLELDQRELIN